MLTERLPSDALEPEDLSDNFQLQNLKSVRRLQGR